MKKTIHWIKKNPLKSILIFMGAAVLLLEIVFVLANTFLPKTSTLFWQDVQPGKSTVEELLEKAGPPIDKQTSGESTIFSYNSDYPVYPHKVYTSKDTVDFVEEWIAPDKGVLLSQYKEKLGEPDFITQAKGSENFKLHVFLKHGIAVNAHERGENVLHVWYFRPMTQEEFFTRFASFLNLAPEQPESFNDNVIFDE